MSILPPVARAEVLCGDVWVEPKDWTLVRWIQGDELRGPDQKPIAGSWRVFDTEGQIVAASGAVA